MSIDLPHDWRGATHAVEVTRRNLRQRSVVVAPLGTRGQQLDLPHSWTTTEERKEPPAFSRDWLYWREQSKQAGAPSPDSIEQALCYAFEGRAASFQDQWDRTRNARAWLAHSRTREFDAAYGIMAAIVLSSGREPAEREEAVQVVRTLGRRALRSMHLETLARYSVVERGRSERARLWKRFCEIESVLRKSIHQAQDVRAIRQFCEAVGIYSDQELTPIAVGLSAATGDLRDIAELENTSPVTVALISLYRTLPQEVPGMESRLHFSHQLRLHDILKRMTMQGLIVTLMPELRFGEL